MQDLNKITKYSLILLSLFTIWGGLIYRLYALNSVGIAGSIIISITSLIIIMFFCEKNKEKTWNTKDSLFIPRLFDAKSLILLSSYLVFILICFWLLYENRSAQSLISPWQVIPQRFFFCYTVATALLVANILQNKKYIPLLISIHYFLSLVICLIVYKIGFGFDPFIHEATIKLIEKTGSVNPKPLYYLGYYGLVLIIHKISFIPLIVINKVITPLLAAIYLPSIIVLLAKRISSCPIKSNLMLLSILTLPFGFLIISTPQGLSYFFLLVSIIFAILAKTNHEFLLTYIVSAAALIIHPIAGIPAVLFTAISHSSNIKNLKMKKMAMPIGLVLMALVLPIAFLWTEKGLNQINGVNINFKNLSNIQLPRLDMPDQEGFILNFVELYHGNIGLFIFLLIASGLLLMIRNKERYIEFLPSLDAALALLLAFFLTNLIPFDFLISYERSNYANRILLISVFLSAPFILISLHSLLESTMKQNIFIKSSLGVFLTLLITVSLYNSYPRLDNYLNSKGYATGQNEIDTVRWIANDADGNYVALANQQVSAAALREFGFSKYYKGDIFLYPIPTGGPLYQKYLDMVYKKPDKETAISAMDLAGVNTAYFVLNKYWWAFPKILEEAKLSTQDFKKIGKEDDIYIFKYQR